MERGSRLDFKRPTPFIHVAIELGGQDRQVELTAVFRGRLFSDLQLLLVSNARISDRGGVRKVKCLNVGRKEDLSDDLSGRG